MVNLSVIHETGQLNCARHFKFENMTVILTVFLSEVAEPASERAAAQYGDFQRKTLEYFKQIHNKKKTKLHKLICSCLTVQQSLSLFLSIQVTVYHDWRWDYRGLRGRGIKKVSLISQIYARS